MELIRLFSLILLFKTVLIHSHNLTEEEEEEIVEANPESEKVIHFLLWNNYLNINTTDLQSIDVNSVDVKDALMNLQEFYKIKDDGKVNPETLELIKKPRCGFPDRSNNFMLGAAKWYKNEITWHFINARSFQNRLTSLAFNTWQKHSSYYTFRYERNSLKADIVIAFKSLKHNFSRCCNRSVCNYDFDGEGQVLAHAYFPERKFSQIEMHIDEDEKWEYGESGSFYQTVLHEIGHTLGIDHSSVRGSVMYPFFQKRNTTDLAEDDIFAVQERYNYPRNTSSATSNVTQKTTTPTTATRTTTMSTTPKPKTTTTTTTTTITSINSKRKLLKPEESNICTYQNELKTFLFVNGKFYIFHKNLVWMRDMRESILHEPDSITNWLDFIITNNISSFEINAIYQQSSSEVVIAINGMAYVLKIPSLKLVHAPVDIKKFYDGLPQQAKINSVFNSYLDYVYILYNDIHLGKINSCSRKFEYLGLSTDYFPGLPARIDGVYRYMDGNLYFMANNFIYVYNEFMKTVIEVKPRNSQSFGFECPNKPLLEQLQLLLNQILFRKIIV